MIHRSTLVRGLDRYKHIKAFKLHMKRSWRILSGSCDMWLLGEDERKALQGIQVLHNVIKG